MTDVLYLHILRSDTSYILSCSGSALAENDDTEPIWLEEGAHDEPAKGTMKEWSAFFDSTMPSAIVGPSVKSNFSLACLRVMPMMRC